MTNRIKHNGWEWIQLSCLLVTGMLCSACHEQTVFHSFRSIPTNGWKRTDTVCFDVAVADSQTHYLMSLELRNRNTYPYRNLLLSITYESPDIPQTTDTVQYDLADAQGMWTGQGWGGLYQNRISLGKITIGKAGHYRFEISHLLPDSTLAGINDIGLLLERKE